MKLKLSDAKRLFFPDKHKVNKIQNSCRDIERKAHSTEENRVSTKRKHWISNLLLTFGFQGLKKNSVNSKYFNSFVLCKTEVK